MGETVSGETHGERPSNSRACQQVVRHPRRVPADLEILLRRPSHPCHARHRACADGIVGDLLALEYPIR